MSKPDINLDSVLGDITDIVKSAGKSFLDGLFKDSTKETHHRSHRKIRQSEPRK